MLIKFQSFYSIRCVFHKKTPASHTDPISATSPSQTRIKLSTVGECYSGSKLALFKPVIIRIFNALWKHTIMIRDKNRYKLYNSCQTVICVDIYIHTHSKHEL